MYPGRVIYKGYNKRTSMPLNGVYTIGICPWLYTEKSYSYFPQRRLEVHKLIESLQVAMSNYLFWFWIVLTMYLLIAFLIERITQLRFRSNYMYPIKNIKVYKMCMHEIKQNMKATCSPKLISILNSRL